MGLFGSIVGGVIGFAVGGPLGAVAGAALGDAAQKVNVKCPHCGRNVLIEEGEHQYVCSFCKNSFTYGNPPSNYNSSNSGRSQHSSNQKSGRHKKRMAANCPHCNAELVIKGDSSTVFCCCNCRQSFTFIDIEKVKAARSNASQNVKSESGQANNNMSHGQPELTDEERNQYLFFISTFALTAKIAKADGVVTREEIAVVDNFMRKELNLSEDELDFARRIFKEAKDSSDPFEKFARQFAALFSAEQNYYRMMLHLLFAISMADGTLHANEENLLKIAAEIFNIDQQEYSQIRAQYIPDTNKYYAILGCSKTDSVETIKSKYKKLAIDFHPDKICSKGLPAEFTEFAKQKFQAIQEAYEKIMEERNK